MIVLQAGDNKYRNPAKLIWQYPFRTIISGSSAALKCLVIKSITAKR